jgi:riboflavin synthase
MFTGIIETLGEVKSIDSQGTNKTFYIESNISQKLKIDQSVAHNGVCLTVISLEGNIHGVTAIQETLEKTNLSELSVGNQINIERCMKSDGRFDGHMVYGHVDGVGVCEDLIEKDGSTEFIFSYPKENMSFLVEKGSVTINGTSLTVFNLDENRFTVAVIPYTLEHTTIKDVQKGTSVNLEYDILGKYVARISNFKNA